MIKRIIPVTMSLLVASGFTSAVYADEEQSLIISGIYGDVTGDNIVDLRDELTLRQYLIERDTAENIRCIDLNNDGVVNITDLAILRHELIDGMSYPLGTPVYEPEDLSEGIMGIDVSKWQGTDIDWEKVKKSGIEFVMIKAGEGTEEEVNFRRNIDGALEAGLKCGVYWFANASTVEEAEAEARACLEAVSGECLEYPVAYDFEYRTLKDNAADGNRELITDMAAAFLERIMEAGYYPLLYSNADFLDNYFYADRLSKFDLWYARYSGKETSDRDCFIWQKSCTGHVDGISTYVDIDVSYKDYSAVIKRYNWNGFQS